MKLSNQKGVMTMKNDLMNRNHNWLDNFMKDDFFNQMTQHFNGFLANEVTPMKADVTENEHQYNVRVDLPGIDKKDIQLDYREDYLIIEAKRESFADHSDQAGNMLTNERYSGRFRRQFYLPAVVIDQIKAKYESGVLAIDLPKSKEDKKPQTTIEIQ